MQSERPIVEFAAEFLRKWGPLMSGTFSVPFGAAAVFAKSDYAKLIWGAMAVAAILFSYFLTWLGQKRIIAELLNRLSPKIMLSLPMDPSTKTIGIEFAKGQTGETIPYIQVCAEPFAETGVDDAVATITKIEHRWNDDDSFSEIMGEPLVADWSRQPEKARLSKGKPIRFSICWYDDNQIFDTPQPMRSYKLGQAYQKIGKGGEYRYKVHVDGRIEGRSIVPSQAYLSVQWPHRGHPKITLEPVSETA